MNKLVVLFYSWKEQIKNFYASAGALIAIISSVLLVAVGMPLQILAHQGATNTAVIGGIAGGLITLLIENLTQKGCGALWKINQETKEAKHKNAELKARTLLELQAKNMPLTVPAAIEEAMASALKEAQAGRNIAFVFIALGVMASIAGNSLFWDAILGTLPLYDVVGVTAIFSFIIPTILIDSELRADLHRELLEVGMESAKNLERVAHQADTRVSLNQGLAEVDKANIQSTATREVLREVSAARMDKMLDEILGTEGLTRQYRADSSGANVIGAKLLQQQLSGPHSPLMLPAPDQNTLALQQVTVALQQLNQQQPRPAEEPLTDDRLATLIDAGVQKALAVQQKEAGQEQKGEAEPQEEVSPATDTAGQEDVEEGSTPSEQPDRLTQQLLGVLNALLTQQQTTVSPSADTDLSEGEDQEGQDEEETQTETDQPALAEQEPEQQKEPERLVAPLPRQFTDEELATLIQKNVQEALAAQQQQASVSSAGNKKRKLAYESHRDLIMQLLQEVEMPEDVRVSKVEAQTGAARSTAHRWLVRARRELEQASVSVEAEVRQADVSAEAEVGQADVSEVDSMGQTDVSGDVEAGRADVSLDDTQSAARLRIVRS